MWRRGFRVMARHLRFVIFLIPVIAFLLGVAGGFSRTTLILNGKFVLWQRLPEVSLKFARIAGIKNSQNFDSPKIYMKTIDEKALEANLDTCFSSPESCWKEVDNIQSVISVGPCSYRFDIRQLPAGATDRMDVCTRFANGPSPSEVHTSAVLLSDGSVWVWRYEHWEIGNLALITDSVFYGFIGLIFGIVIAFSLWFSKRSKTNFIGD